MTTKKYSYKPDKFLFKLYAVRDIIENYNDAILNLFAACANDDEVELVKHILSNMTVLSEAQARYALKSLLEVIREISKGRPTAIVATSMGVDPDSSQAIVQLMKPLARDDNYVTFFNSVAPYTRKMNKFEYCFLVDEFSGTGNTITQRLNQIKNEETKRQTNIKNHVLLIAAMEKAIELILKTCSAIHVEFTFKAGISAHFSTDLLQKNTEIMKKFESRLSKTWKDRPLPSFGYGEAEALYSVHEWNAPNSNFPILWWPRHRNGKLRRTLFVREAP